MKPQLLASCALLALSAWVLPAHAVGSLADITVIDRNTGATLPVYSHGGEYWVAGQAGAKYAIAVYNKSTERVLAVTAVDGVNVVSGQTAAWNQAGYVFASGQQYRLTGWRKSSSEVAAFEFSALGDSYAARTGRPANVGVIGVALFREQQPEPVVQAPAVQPPVVQKPMDPARFDRPGEVPEWYRRSLSRPPASRQASPEAPVAGQAEQADRVGNAAEASAAESRPPAVPLPAAKLGTGHGARENSAASQTTFVRRQVQPDEVIRIRYDSRENLIASGVIPQPAAAAPVAPVPNAFPDSRGFSYVPDPN
ncbi:MULTISPECIES: hypothetical protein [unclassified Polaromonas]|uniref:hypothetical protein n=1 Tax=unclassified Polaromonas TaxID=2638319 RepID=UPI000F0763FE|nr:MULTISPECIES: hypothetical protein [unclassified Polaromonas]AYQ30110.1 hypothetical protein DT070_20080 [Polaromonas sp. SP1]QGJ18776.1 hypothetical protein F7R28_10480 [Polaromonas sp. Pch-P]